MDKPKSFHQKKKDLRRKYKLLKAGLIKQSDLTPTEQKLLNKYYKIEFP